MAINILIIDDDKRPLTRMVDNLRRADSERLLGVIEIDDSIVDLDTVEKYDASKYGVKFDVALIDYQLSSTFTGILFSAWIALALRIPRIALSTADYPGDPSYFSCAILKREITDNPESVIQRIASCVEMYNSDTWLSEQHQQLVEEYQKLLQGGTKTPALEQLDTLLDKFERILDAKQEGEIKKVLEYELRMEEYQKRQKDFNDRFEALSQKLQRLQGDKQ